MLHDAISKARLKEVRAMLAEGANPNARDEHGWRPIHLALMCRSAARDSEIRARTRIATLLLDHGADPNARDPERKTALWHALAMGPIGRRKGKKIVARLMREKPDLRARDFERYAILHMASVYGYEDVVRRALAAKAPVDGRDASGGTRAPPRGLSRLARDRSRAPRRGRESEREERRRSHAASARGAERRARDREGARESGREDRREGFRRQHRARARRVATPGRRRSFPRVERRSLRTRASRHGRAPLQRRPPRGDDVVRKDRAVPDRARRRSEREGRGRQDADAASARAPPAASGRHPRARRGRRGHGPSAATSEEKYEGNAP